LLSSSSPYVVFGFVFTVGAASFVAGSLLLRAAKDEPPPVAVSDWTTDVIGDDRRLDAAERVDIVERLAMIGQPWCIDTLEAALAQERDAQVRDAVERALLVMRARATASYESI
jgi:hypothetical protein